MSHNLPLFGYESVVSFTYSLQGAGQVEYRMLQSQMVNHCLKVNALQKHCHAWGHQILPPNTVTACKSCINMYSDHCRELHKLLFFNFHFYDEWILRFRYIKNNRRPLVKPFVAAIKPVSGTCGQHSHLIESSIVINNTLELNGCGRTLATFDGVYVLKIIITPYEFIEIQHGMYETPGFGPFRPPDCLNDDMKANVSAWFQPALQQYSIQDENTYHVFSDSMIKAVLPSTSGVVLLITGHVKEAVVNVEVITHAYDLIETVTQLKHIGETVQVLYATRGNSSFSYSTYGVASIHMTIHATNSLDISFKFLDLCVDVLEYSHQISCCSVCNYSITDLYLMCRSKAQLNVLSKENNV